MQCEFQIAHDNGDDWNKWLADWKWKHVECSTYGPWSIAILLYHRNDPAFFLYTWIPDWMYTSLSPADPILSIVRMCLLPQAEICSQISFGLLFADSIFLCTFNGTQSPCIFCRLFFSISNISIKIKRRAIHQNRNSFYQSNAVNSVSGNRISSNQIYVIKNTSIQMSRLLICVRLIAFHEQKNGDIHNYNRFGFIQIGGGK